MLTDLVTPGVPADPEHAAEEPPGHRSRPAPRRRPTTVESIYSVLADAYRRRPGVSRHPAADEAGP